MNGKASTVLNPGSFVEIFLGLWLLNFETCNFLLKRSRLFFSVKAFLCFYDKKIVHGCLQLWKFSTWYQEIITAYILLIDTSLVRCSHSRDIELNTRGEIPYQRAPCIIHYLLIGDKMAEIVIQPQCKISEKWPCTTILMRVCGLIAQWSLFIRTFLHTLIWAREDVRRIWESYVKPTRSRGFA